MGLMEQIAELRVEEAKEEARAEMEEKVQMTNRLFVENLLSNTDFSTEKIAFLANVTVEFVMSVKEEKRA